MKLWVKILNINKDDSIAEFSFVWLFVINFTLGP